MTPVTSSSAASRRRRGPTSPSRNGDRILLASPQRARPHRPDYFSFRRKGRGVRAPARRGGGEAYPRLRDNPDYSSILNDRRPALAAYLARSAQARASTRSSGGDDFAGSPQMPPHLVRGPPTLCAVRREDLRPESFRWCRTDARKGDRVRECPSAPSRLYSSSDPRCRASAGRDGLGRAPLTTTCT